MRVDELEIGRYYRLMVNSEVGYSDYIYIGKQISDCSPNAEPEICALAFERVYEGGTEWFYPNEKGDYSIAAMYPLDKYDFHYLLEELQSCQGTLNYLINLIAGNKMKIANLQEANRFLENKKADLVQHMDDIKFKLSQNKKENKEDDGNE